jgi:hypothetical protein
MYEYSCTGPVPDGHDLLEQYMQNNDERVTGVQVYGQGVIKKALSFIFADDWQKALAEHPALIQTLEDLQNMTWPCFHAALDNETIASASTGMRHSQEKQVTAGRGILCKYPEYQHPAAASPGHEATWAPPGSDGRPCARTTWATKVPVLGADVTTLWQRHNGRWASRGDLVIKEHWRDQGSNRSMQGSMPTSRGGGYNRASGTTTPTPSAPTTMVGTCEPPSAGGTPTPMCRRHEHTSTEHGSHSHASTKTALTHKAFARSAYSLVATIPNDELTCVWRRVSAAVGV